ncbi:Stk1 family PASTA domain-containing Ser/Thr kinase [Oscillospiraceae bacterium OttesenSCG-928-F05]|nr:Stk1 family PASTA domain-containing Ser/Thr kinase [Oscillospiraceae bacterium OttesenSCG-928-F05]
MDNDKYIGKMLDNRYEILEVIGMGGMAVVYKARCHRLNRLVAIKILKDEFMQDEEFRRRFHAESQAVAMLGHPNIVAVYDVSRSETVEYLVMELIDGITLKQYMARKGQLNWREALHFTTQVVRALGHAHGRGIIHRDIKPHNIMVLRDGSVKVADFGIARFATSQNTLTQEALGSVHYISPEQAKGSHIDARSDIYSVGVVLYEMLTNRLPYEGDSPVSVAIQHINSMPLTPREIDPSIPEGLEEITMKAMASDMAKRYMTAEEMYRDLEDFRKNPTIRFGYEIVDYSRAQAENEPTKKMALAGERRPAAQTPRTPPVVQSAPRKKKRRRGGSPVAMILAVLGIVAFVVGMVVFFWNVVKPILLPEDTEVEVPNFVGMRWEDVEFEPDYESFTFRTTEEFSDKPAGEIIDQRPAAERTMKSGGTVSLTVSKGQNVMELPSFFNKEYRAVQLELGRLGLSVGELIYENSDVLQDYVIRTDPDAGSRVAEGGVVTLYISLGPEVNKVKMPNLVGRTLDEARVILQATKLSVGLITTEDNEKPMNEIVGQSIKSGEEVEEGAVVDLTVSLGPLPTQTPEPTPTPTLEPTPPPSDTGADADARAE